MSTTTPEQRARATIDCLLEAAGWTVQDVGALNLHAGRGVAVREFPLRSGHGFADYLLYVDGKAAGVVEAKPEGYTLTGVESPVREVRSGIAAQPPCIPSSVAVPVREHRGRYPVHQRAGSSASQPDRLLLPYPGDAGRMAGRFRTVMGDWAEAGCGDSSSLYRPVQPA